MGSFVGEKRHEALMLLEGAFSEVLQGRHPQVALITGLPGSGKTRLIQEFFATLSRQQKSSRYWPPSIVETENKMDVLRYRFKVNPDRVRDTSVNREFSWFAQVGQRSVENPDLDIRSLSEALFQFQSLHPERRHQVVGKLLIGVIVIGAVVVEFLDNYLSLHSSLKLVARSAALAGLGFGIYEQSKKIIDLRHRRSVARRGTPQLGANSVDKCLDLVKHEVENAGCPTVIVIDDWHAAATPTLDLVEKCLELDGPCLIILARWLGGSGGADGNEIAKLIEDAAITRIHLQPMEASELQQILRGAASELSTELQIKVAEHADGNPLICLRMSRMPQVVALNSRNVADEDVERILGAIPFDHEGILVEQWRQLPTDIQRYLCTASIFGEVIPTERVKEAFSKYFTGDPDEVLSRARNEHLWLQVFQSDVDRFPEGVLYKIAKNQAKVVLGEREVGEIAHRVALLHDEDLPEPLRTTGALAQIAGDHRLSTRVNVGLGPQNIEDVKLVFQQVVSMPASSRFANLRAGLCQDQIRWLEAQDTQGSATDEIFDYLVQFKYYEFKSVAKVDPHDGLKLGYRLREIIGSHSLVEDLILRLGNTHIDLGEYDVAATHYEELLKMPRSHVRAEAWANLQICKVRLGMIDEAISSVKRRVIRLRIVWWLLYVLRQPMRTLRLEFVEVTEELFLMLGNLGDWHCQKGNLPRGLRCQRAAIRTVSRISQRSWIRELAWTAHLKIGYWYLKSHEFDAAYSALAKILDEPQSQGVFPRCSNQFVRAQLLRVIALLGLEKSTEARESLDSVLNSDSESCDGLETNRWLAEVVLDRFSQPFELLEEI